MLKSINWESYSTFHFHSSSQWHPPAHPLNTVWFQSLLFNHTATISFWTSTLFWHQTSSVRSFTSGPTPAPQDPCSIVCDSSPHLFFTPRTILFAKIQASHMSISKFQWFSITIIMRFRFCILASRAFIDWHPQTSHVSSFTICLPHAHLTAPNVLQRNSWDTLGAGGLSIAHPNTFPLAHNTHSPSSPFSSLVFVLQDSV